MWDWAKARKSYAGAAFAQWRVRRRRHDDRYDGLELPPTEVVTEGGRTLVMAGRNVQAVYELPSRSIIDWTPSAARQAIQLADGGSFRNAALLCEAIMNDDRVQGVLGARTHGLLRLPKLFYGSNDEAVEALQGEQDVARRQQATPGDWDRMYPEEELAKLVAWGVLLGIGLGELVPSTELREPGDRAVPRLKVWHPQWLRWQWDIDQWFLTTSQGEIPITPGDGRWILYTPYGINRPWAFAPWRPLSFAWVLKQFALHDRARASEVYGSAVRAGKAPQGARESARRKFLTDLRAMGRDGVQVFPEGWSLELIEATGRTWPIFKDSIEWADRAMSTTLAGQSVTSEGTSGFANASIFQSIALTFIEFTAISASRCLYEQGTRPWARANFGSPKEAPFGYWDTTPPEDKEALAQGLGFLGDAIAKLDQALRASHKRVDAAALAQKFGVPLLDGAAPAVALPGAAPVGGTQATDPALEAKSRQLREARAA